MRLSDNVKLAQPDLVLAAATTFTTDTNVVDMSNYRRMRAILTLNQASAGTGIVTLKQSATADGSDEKALAYVGYLKNETGVTSDDLTAVAATALTTAGPTAGSNTYIFEIQSSELDQANAFRYVRLDLASLAGNTAASLRYELYDPRHTCGAEDMPAAIA
jgi:hypothetical protein